MTVCKGYLKIIWRNMGQNLMYLAIVLFVTIGMASQTEKTQENIFSRGSVDIAIVDEDGGAAAEGVVRFLRKNNSVTLTDASAEALSRKLYYREIDFVIRIPETEEHFSGILAVVPLQLLGYYISVAKGLDVDKPRNLAKSVTVE